jgi:hypothetical protein
MGDTLTVNAPQAKAIPHPFIEGAWTLEDKLQPPTGRLLMFASKTGAEVAASKRNEQRRQQK